MATSTIQNPLTPFENYINDSFWLIFPNIKGYDKPRKPRKVLKHNSVLLFDIN